MPPFLDHAPVPLTFGTSGLRGPVKDITDLEAYINVRGALRYLGGLGEIRPGDVVVVAGDLRPSTERILGACARAVVDAGLVVENAGRVPTPALMLHCMATGRAGVMVTGSHIPFDRNGIKINRPAGELLKADEPGIEREVAAIRGAEYARAAETTPFLPTGMLKAALGPPGVDPAAEARYVRRYVDAFAGASLGGARVAVYQHSAVGRDLLVRVLRDLGVDAVACGRSETFVPIDTENVDDELLARLSSLVAGAGEGRFDAIVSTDGDSDRPLVAAISPHSRGVRFLPGDLLGIVVAELLGADAAVVPVSANDAVERRMKERGVVLRKTRIGSPFVVLAMRELQAAGGHARVVGWEANGGFLTGTPIELPWGATLPALPTRDALLPILANLAAAARSKLDLGALWDRLPARYGRSGLLDAIAPEASRAIVAGLSVQGAASAVAFASDGAVRALGLDGAASELSPSESAAWRERRATIASFFGRDRGFGGVSRIDALDGVRVSFDDGDVAHVRPSGNAPQLRIYANSDTQARADRIVAMGLEEPGGILRSLERALG